MTPEERKREMEKEIEIKEEKEKRTSLQKMKKGLWKLGRIANKYDTDPPEILRLEREQ